MNVLLHGALGFLGMLLWLRKGWNLSWLAAFVGAAVVVFSSFMGLHLAAGHSRKVAAAWIPWVLLFVQRACIPENTPPESREQRRAHRWQSLRFAAPAGGFLALMLLDGSVYLSIYSATFVVLVGILKSLQGDGYFRSPPVSSPFSSVDSSREYTSCRQHIPKPRSRRS
jgi:hypothetical protein